jgi:hypothetical protein
MHKKYTTKDFYLSALLVTEGYELADHVRENGFTTFTFENSAKLQNLVNKFYSLKVLIEPVKYSQSIRSLKGILHSSVSTANQPLKNEHNYNSERKI